MVKPKIINTPTHPTTGQIVVRDYEAGRIKDLAHHIDKLLNKELMYGIYLGKSENGKSAHSTYTTIPKARENVKGKSKSKRRK